MLMCTSVGHSFSLMSNIPLCKHTAICLSFLLLNIWVFSCLVSINKAAMYYTGFFMDIGFHSL